TSVGPFSPSVPTTPRSTRLAAATYTFPGPVITSTGAQSSVPYANMASACAPPAACTSRTPSSAHAASTTGCGRPSRCGGDATATAATPATWAGTTFITTEDG